MSAAVVRDQDLTCSVLSQLLASEQDYQRLRSSTAGNCEQVTRVCPPQILRKPQRFLVRRERGRSEYD